MATTMVYPRALHHSSATRASHARDRREELANEHGYGDEDDLGDLSDSPSSHTSYSRPVTPQEGPHSVSISTATTQADHPYAIAQKAERVLGLRPGTLPHARAALESAKEEVRRLDHPVVPLVPLQHDDSGGVKGRIDRAVKAMSIAMPHGTRMPMVVIGTGGKEEEARREKVRRANDGVLYWQKEVARLAAEDASTLKTNTTRKNR